MPVRSMDFSMRDPERLLKLVRAAEKSLAKTRITDWFDAEFFVTNFWLKWSPHSPSSPGTVQ